MIYFSIDSFQIKDEVIRHGQGMSDEVSKATEITTHSLNDLTKQIDRVRRKLDGESSALREAQQVMELEIAEIRQAIKKTEEGCAKILSVSLPTAQR